MVDFSNGGGTTDQRLKDGNRAIRRTRLNCHDFDAILALLQLHVLAYNMGKFLRRRAAPSNVRQWPLTTLRDKLIKIGAKVVHRSPIRHVSTGRGRGAASVGSGDP